MEISPTSTAHKQVRQSNMELLRMVSMLLVLVIHANTAFAPWPIGQQSVLDNPVHCSLRFLIESLSVVCVNSFILLSGWFGIKFSFKRLLSFVFQVLFFSLILSLLPSARGQGAHLFVDVFTLNQYWFVRAYIILFILSPALNLFAERASKVLFRNVLIAFFIMQTLFAYISNSNWFEDGFSPLPFIGLYLLSRYIRIHKPAFSTLGKGADAGVYSGIALLITLLSVLLFRFFSTGGRLYNYTNPLVIAASVYFVLFFSKLNMRHSPAINWFAASAVGAYLLHMNPLFFQPYYIRTLQSFSGHGSPLLIVGKVLGFIITIFLAGVLLDKVRGLIWEWGLRVFHAE